MPFNIGTPVFLEIENNTSISGVIDNFVLEDPQNPLNNIYIVSDNEGLEYEARESDLTEVLIVPENEEPTVTAGTTLRFQAQNVPPRDGMWERVDNIFELATVRIRQHPAPPTNAPREIQIVRSNDLVNAGDYTGTTNPSARLVRFIGTGMSGTGDRVAYDFIPVFEEGEYIFRNSLGTHWINDIEHRDCRNIPLDTLGANAIIDERGVRWVHCPTYMRLRNKYKNKTKVLRQKYKKMPIILDPSNYEGREFIA